MKKFTSTSVLVLFLLTLFVFPVTVLADSGDGGDEITRTVEGYQVTVVFEKLASLGENPIHIRVVDAQKMPVSQAEVEISVVEVQEEHVEKPSAGQHNESGMEGMTEKPTAESSMSGMEGMSEKPAADNHTTDMESKPEKPQSEKTEIHDQMVKLAAGHEKGEYEGEISISNTGDATLRVHLTVQGELMEVDFPFHVSESQTGKIVLGGFFALNAAIIAAAVILKNKPVL